MTARIALAMTGGSGVQYALKLLKVLVAEGCHVYLMMSDAAKVVINTETNLQLPESLEETAIALSSYATGPGRIEMLGKTDWFSAPASGSHAPDAMVVVPASGGTVSAIAIGASNNLIERAADVMLKERKPLILVPRETPLSKIHLKNMLAATDAGAIVMPASPGFYNNPQSIEDLIDFMVARILDHLSLPQSLQPRWGDSCDAAPSSKD